ncbi:MAG: hypothetical protein WCD38_07575, partial [Candidatus Tumulicola sp.]
AGAFDLEELPKGKGAFAHVMLNQKIDAPGGVKWDGKYLTIGDSTKSVVYRFAITGTKGTEIGALGLGGAKQVFEYAIEPSRLVVPDYGNGVIAFYRYPAGGSPLQTYHGPIAPYGAAISTVSR